MQFEIEYKYILEKYSTSVATLLHKFSVISLVSPGSCILLCPNILMNLFTANKYLI